MEWQPIETFDYEAECARTGNTFVPAWVTDGKQVIFAEHWGNDGGDNGWREALNVGYGGPDQIGFEPTHWIGKPAPPAK